MTMKEVFSIVLLASLSHALPDLRDSIQIPIAKFEGEDALLTCVVRNQGNYSVIWKKQGQSKDIPDFLTVGHLKVTNNPRMDIIHDDGGDVWVLVIKSVIKEDSGTYLCVVNTEREMRSFHQLRVIPLTPLPPPVADSSIGINALSVLSEDGDWYNFSSCCHDHGVSPECDWMCILNSNGTIHPGMGRDICQKDYPSVISCMSDGRNHVPCCMEQGVPDSCLELCRGAYTQPQDNIQSHFSCLQVFPSIVQCSISGIGYIPSTPDSFAVRPVSKTTLKLTWTSTAEGSVPIDHFLVNLTRLQTFDDFYDYDQEPETSVPKAMQVTIPADLNMTEIENLSANTMYEISMSAVNKRGSSVPTKRIRVITKEPPQFPVDQDHMLEVPDTRSCCFMKGIKEERCLQRFCDPYTSDVTTLPDMMICAPWANEFFSCVANNIDHTDCCVSRGLPPICLNLCSGNVTKLDYHYFRCIPYISSYQSCVLTGYGVVPTRPLALNTLHVDNNYVILTWNTPSKLGETVTGYNVHYRPFGRRNEEYMHIGKVHPPYILEKLSPGMEYEVFVEPANTYGIGEPSSRIIFSTKTPVEKENLENIGFQYNYTECCLGVNVTPKCIPLCDYEAKMTDMRQLGPQCGEDFYKMLKCGVGGRNHKQCCQQRGVTKECLSLCVGVVTKESTHNPETCVEYMGNIAQCFQEGTGLIPSPVEHLRASNITKDSVTLTWDEPAQGNVSFYEIHYQEAQNLVERMMTMNHKITVNSDVFIETISNLDSKVLYEFFVVAYNEFGSSLPTTLLTINLTNFDEDLLHGVTTPPHSLTVAHQSVSFITVSWYPPELSHPTDRLKYRLYYQLFDDEAEQWNSVDTDVTVVRLEGLKPNSLYVLYATTLSEKGESQPSESLVVWTDPAYPAFVEPPTIHPINLVLEGSTITVLCIAMGAPMPLVSLYISGNLVKQEVTRHMVAVVKDITRDMGEVSCYADNGYGTPAQSSITIDISHRPHIEASELTLVTPGETAELLCQVEAWPEPNLVWWRDPNGRIPIIHGGNYQIITKTKEEKGKYIMQLKILETGENDTGYYYCHAENAFGTFTQTLNLKARQKPISSLDIISCCQKLNVSSECLEACTFDVDFDLIANRPECIQDFDKLMKCASDGSDHRNCCNQWGVPKRCLDWCRGNPVINAPLCGTGWAKQIIACFEEGKDILPGPPESILIQQISEDSVEIRWKPPVKNPETVELYRVFWRPVGEKEASKNDTQSLKLLITGLKEGMDYEYAIKSGNHYGTSILTQPVVFQTKSKYISSASTKDTDNGQMEIAIGIVVAVLCVIAIMIISIFYIKKRKLFGLKTNSGGVSFENPSYMRENVDTIQISSIPESRNGTTQSNGWKTETLHPSNHPDNSGLYEELKLGQNSAGFRKLTS